MLLALDSSTNKVGVALYDGARVVSETIWESPFHHTVELAPAINRIMERATLSTDDLSALAVALGPGSYNGLRIGLALIKGIALAKHLPVIGVPTLDVLAYAQPVTLDALAVVINAGRGRLGVGWYKAVNGVWKRKKDFAVLKPKELSRKIRKPTIVCGELDADLRRLLRRKRVNVRLASPADSLRRPSYLAELAWTRWQDGTVDDPRTLVPFYLHPGEPIPS